MAVSPIGFVIVVPFADRSLGAVPTFHDEQ